MTIYVRIEGTSEVFPPAKFIISSTKEGIPSEPWNLTGRQINTNHVLLSWNAPHQPNGIITAYKIVLNSKDYGTKTLIIRSNLTSYSLSSNFQHNGTYTFRVSISMLFHLNFHNKSPDK